MKITHSSLLAAAFALTLAGNAHAQFLMAGWNPATSSTVAGSTPIFGVYFGSTPADYTGAGTAYSNGSTASLDDGNTSSRDDTYNYTAFATSPGSAYVGYSFTTAAYKITSMTVQFQLNYDGGWFGTHDSWPGPAANTTLSAYLVEPTLQYSKDGVTWTTVSDSSNYLSILSPLYSDSNNTGVVTFTPDSAIIGAKYVRLIGPSGGVAGYPAGGFLAVNEESLYGVVPEPSTYATLGLGLAALVLIGRLRRQATRV